MTHDELDRLLRDDEAIVPSSGFAPSVMEVVTRQASEPPAIPFPWTRALPALASLGVALLAALVSTMLFGSWQSDRTVRPIVDLVTTSGRDIGWIALAVMLTVASVALSWRLTRS